MTRTPDGAGPAGQPHLADLARSVADLSNRVVDGARSADRPELADLVAAAAGRWAEPTVTVVVAGEVGLGKTSLVNALVGRQDLLPTGDEGLASVVTIETAAGSSATADDRPGYQVVLDGRDHPIETTRAELPSWSSGPASSGTVAEVRVQVPPPGSAVTLVDTPGVAGPHTIADQLVLAVLKRADLLLFVANADAPIGRTELTFLEQARHEIGACTVVLTRIDRFRGWTTIRDDTDEILRRELPGWASPTTGVSAVLAAEAAALRTAEPELADELAAEAGVDRLRATLDARVRHAKHLRLLTLLSVQGRVIDALLEPVRAAEAAHEAPDDERRRRLDDLRAEHAALRARGATVVRRIPEEIAAIREELGVAVRRVVGEVTLAHEERLLGSGVDADEVLDALESDLRAAQVRFATQVDGWLAQLGERLVDELEGDAEADVEPAEGAGDVDGFRRGLPVGGDASLRLRVAAAVASAGGGTALVGMTFMGGATVGIVRSGLMGISMVLGGIVANSGVRQSRNQRVVQTVRSQARTILDEWTAAVVAGARQRVLVGQRELDTALRAALGGRLDELDGEVQAIEAVSSADETERRRILAAAATSRHRLDALDRERLALLATVRDVIAPVEPSDSTTPYGS